MQDMEQREGDFTPNPITFGDKGEFIFDSLTEMISPVDNRVVQAALYFYDSDRGDLRGLSIIEKTPEGLDQQPDSPNDTPVIEAELIDPDCIVSILQLPSSDLLSHSTSIEDSSSESDA